MKQQNARSLSETDACPAWQILLQCRRPDADGAVSEGKKTKNIKHSGNLTKNVFLDLHHYRAHFRLLRGSSLPSCRGRTFAARCARRAWQRSSRALQRSPWPFDVRSAPPPCNGDMRDRLTGSTVAGDLGNLFRSRLHWTARSPSPSRRSLDGQSCHSESIAVRNSVPAIFCRPSITRSGSFRLSEQ